MPTTAAEFWSDHLSAIERDGVTVAEYARRHDLSAQSLYAWRSRSRERSTSSSTERRVQFTEVVTTQSVARSGLLLRLGDAVLEFDDLAEAVAEKEALAAELRSNRHQLLTIIEKLSPYARWRSRLSCRNTARLRRRQHS